MITFSLHGHAEKLAPEGHYPPELQRRPLYHQVRTLEALRDHPVVINTYNTGTGKTFASLLHLLELNGQRKNVLFIAPTNALIEQHTADIRKFVRDNNLAYTVKPVRAPDITTLKEQVSAEEDIDLRRGELLYRLVRNPREFDPDIPGGHALIMVTNPDIFYYALYFHYHPHDQRNIASEFIKNFDYIVVDEFHYYSNKQLVSFLFAFTLFDQFGYFSEPQSMRRVCLLSATPRANVLRYMRALFGERFKLIEPGNEPAESTDYDTIPVLAPLQVTVQSGSLSDWIETAGSTLTTWLRQDDLDGALISSSLAQINDAYQVLRRRLDESLMGRITGPEKEEARQKATGRKLILATPTVDIGYNFDKLEKTDRQNIDFVVCDARFGDELVQRVGRAGRILGKTNTHFPSHAVLLLSEQAAGAFSKFDGQTREQFSKFVQQLNELPAKHQLEGYIRSYAIQELFWPIYKLRQMMTDPGLAELDMLYDRLCQVFAPDFRHRDKQLNGYMKKYEKREQWLKTAQENKRQVPEGTDIQLADWMEWNEPLGGKPDLTALRPHIVAQWHHPKQRQELIAFVESQVALTRALFKFRDSFQGPRVAFFDPDRLFSSESVNVYDLFHLLSHYHLSAPMSSPDFKRRVGEEHEPLDADFYCLLGKHRDTRLSVEFVLDTPLSSEEFNKRWTCLPVALHGLRLQLREYGGDPVTGGVDLQMAQSLADQPIVMLIVPPTLGYVRNTFKGTEIWSRRLTINFDTTGEQVDNYLVFVGTSAFEAHAELKSVFWRAEKRQREEAIIL